MLDWLLGVNVNRSIARPIYATTPIQWRKKSYSFPPAQALLSHRLVE
ncbi:MAG: hypothetical protein VB135_05190 [Burkholderia sp.]